MSRMGMLKTAISGRFGLGGQVLGGDVPTDIDVGATQPDTPNHHHTRSKKDKRSKSDNHHSKATNTKQVGPAIMLKKDNQELKHGHDPNKINSMISKRHIIVEPSTRHMNYQPSTRNLGAEPSTRDVMMKSPQKSVRTMGFDKKSSMRNMNSSSGMRNTNGFDKKSSIRNLGSPTKMGTSPRVANVNNIEAFDNKKKLNPRNAMLLGMASIEETIGNSNLSSIDENNSRNTNLNGTSNTSSNTSKGSSSPTSTTSKSNGSANNKKTLTRTPIMNSIEEGNSTPSTTTPMLGTIDENNNSSSRSSSRNRSAIDENNNNSSRNSSRNRSIIDENKPNSSSSRNRSIIDENKPSSSSSRNRSTIDENKPNSSTSSNNNNPNNDTTARSASSQKSNNSSSGRSPVSTSMKSTSSTNTTKSTSTKSAESPVSLNHNINNNSVTSLNITKSNLSSHSSTSANNNSATNLGNSTSNMSNKSAHSLSARSEKTRNADNRTKSRPKPPRKRGPSLVTPAHFNRDRPSTVLITRKEMEDILAEKQREEAIEAKTLPPKSGTMSTDLWLDAANKEPQSEEFSVASGTSVEEESPFGKKPHLGLPEDEYDINFFDITEEEEITEHTINSGNQSFDANELHFTDSIEQRCTTIRFDEYDELQTCLHINDYTNGEISRSWYKREDYDKMVDLARKTASKAVKREKELRDELENMLRVSVSPKAGRKNGEMRPEDPAGGDDNRSTHSGKSTDGKRKKPIEYRGLEAWTPEGSQKCRTLKENAIELVWNEQSRQWEEGTFDPDAIAEVYKPVAKIALKAAHERALADEKMVKRLTEQEKKKKKNRTGFNRATHAIKKTSKNTSKAVGHAAGKVLTETGKGAVKIGKRSGKALVATATLDPKMMKEAVKVRIHGKKKRECKHELEVTTSKAAVERDIEELEESGSLSLQDSNSLPFYNPNPLDRRQLLQMQKPQKPSLPTTYEVDVTSDKVSDDLSSANGGISADLRDGSYRTGDSESNVSSPKKKSKLKLLGIVPIPGTQKKYSEDRRQEREEKRKEKMTRRPSWESSMTTGKH